MLASLTLGNKIFPTNLIQGPLAGISAAPFRLLTHAQSQPAFSCTEMISCKTLLHQPGLVERRYIAKDKGEGALCFQLSGSDPLELAEATKRVSAYGADLIDLNCGCPVKKIRTKGAGSRLLAEPLKLYHLIRAMKQNTSLPVSIKIRVDGQDEHFNTEVAKVVSEAGADFLVVHGRHWTEHYETPCRYDAIQFFVEALKIPVIGNGDISDLASLRRMFATGCAGAMLGRAGVGQPWLIRKLSQEWRGEFFVPPTAKEQGSFFIEHVKGLRDLLGQEKLALLQARQFAKYYARFLPCRTALTAELNNCTSLSDLETIVAVHFK